MRTSEPLKRGVLWTYLAISGFVAIEPSPYEFMFPIALIAFADGGMLFGRALAPLIACLLVYDASGFIPFFDEKESFNFTFITLYMSLATILFAAIVAASPLARMRTIRSGYVAAGVISALLGIIGYFNIAGMGQYFTAYDNTRAMGFFKDPNVFGPFLAPPVVWLFQDLLLRRGRSALAVACLIVLLTGVLLSFSRGAIVDCLLSIMLLLGLTFLTATTSEMRARTLKIAALGLAMLVAIVVIILAVPAAHDLAMERATLAEDYDSGPQGRFGNQLRSIPMLVTRPLGFGPQRFAHIFPQDPHEVFISAFGSFGWSGGLAFTVFFAVTLYYGWRICFRRSALQPDAVAVWAALFPQLLQGFQIDTNHWRHMFLMISCIYGLTAAERRRREPAPAGLQALRSAGL
jgi:hypothetical protein